MLAILDALLNLVLYYFALDLALFSFNFSFLVQATKNNLPLSISLDPTQWFVNISALIILDKVLETIEIV